MIKTNKGFTLIELLVVIAIIGVLASVVLASLSSARNKGADASIKSQLSSARAQAELFSASQTSPTYDAVCTTAGSANGIQGLVQAAMNSYNGTTTVGNDTTAATSTTSACHDSASAWAAMVPLKAPGSGMIGFCVDSTGFAKETATGLPGSGATQYTCA